MLKITGLNQLRKKMERLEKYANTGIVEDLDEWGTETINIAKKSHKYKDETNDLTDSLSVSSSKKDKSVRLYIDFIKASEKGFNYGLAQHNGTKYIKADPFLFRAAKQNIKKIHSIISDSIRKMMR